MTITKLLFYFKEDKFLPPSLIMSAFSPLFLSLLLFCLMVPLLPAIFLTPLIGIFALPYHQSPVDKSTSQIYFLFKGIYFKQK